MFTKQRVLIAVLSSIVMLVVGLMLFPVALPHVSLPAERVGDLPDVTIGSISVDGAVTNTILASWLAMLVLVVISLIARARLSLRPGRFQALIEFIVEALYGLFRDIAGERNARRFFALATTIFLFLLVTNWMGVLPGYGTVGFIETVHDPKIHGQAIEETHFLGLPVGVLVKGEPHGEPRLLVPVLRSAATDLNLPLALALIVMVFVQIMGVRELGVLTYLSKFIDLRGFVQVGRAIAEGRGLKGAFGAFFNGFISLFVGLLELFSELGKVVSLSFRLFGNLFAGEVLLAVVMFLIPWMIVLPFLALETFVGFIQALVFAMLTVVYLTMAMTFHGEAGEHHQTGDLVSAEAHSAEGSS